MYDRTSELKTVFNNAVNQFMGLPEDDYYSKLSVKQILGLKSMLSKINNIITLRLAFSLVEWICARYNLSDDEKQDIENKIRVLKPNTNGYDIEIHAPDIVAEVKCNIPINCGSFYGSAQRNGLIRDIAGLLNGKSKSKKKTSDSVKLLGLYDTKEVRRATEHLVDKLPDKLNGKVIINPQDNSLLETSKVYIVYLK